MRPAREIMGDLAATGMTPDQIALVMELSAAVSAEARPIADESAVRRRERDKEYQAQKRNERRQISADSDDSADAPLSRPPNENNSNPPTHTQGNITTRETANPFPRPEGVDPSLWADFRANRKAKKLTNTASAYSKFQRDLAAECARTGWPPGEVLRACVERGWGGIYKITEQNNGQQRQSGNRGGSTRDAAQLALARMGHG